MKFNKKYLVQINLDIPEPEELGATKEKYEAASKEVEKNLPDAITTVLCNDLEDLKSFGLKYEVKTSEVKHGKWIFASERVNIGMKCSLCGARIKNSEFFNGNHNYCHKCGARMDGDAP